MAQFDLIDEDQWPPGRWPEPANGAKVSKIYVPKKNGTKITVVVNPGDRRVTTNDERAIRVMDADPRFTRIS